MQQSTYKDILEQYKFFIMDYIYVSSTYHMLNLESKIVFKDNKRITEILEKEVQEYINSYKKELKIYNFLLKKERKLYTEDIYGTIDNLIEEYKIKHKYIEELFEKLETAIGTELEYKFYLPKNKPKYITDEDVEKYKIYAMGYNKERIEDFLKDEVVYEEKILDEEMKKIKELDINAYNNMDMFGIFDNGKILVPKVKDELTALISIHELVHNSLILNKDKINNDFIAYGEDIPIFYELLFQSTNDFSKIEIHKTDIALKLLESYQGEPFDIQIKKVKELVKS